MMYGVHRKPILAPQWKVLECTVHPRVRCCTKATVVSYYNFMPKKPNLHENYYSGV